MMGQNDGMKRGSFLKSLLLVPFAAKAMFSKPEVKKVPVTPLPWDGVSNLKVYLTDQDVRTVAICPPLMYPAGRPPIRLGAGVRVPNHPNSDYYFH